MYEDKQILLQSGHKWDSGSKKVWPGILPNFYMMCCLYLTIVSVNGCLNGSVKDAMMSCSGMCPLGETFLWKAFESKCYC